jgi:hypothetical protein
VRRSHKPKKNNSLTVFFVLLGSARKAARKMLVKWTLIKEEKSHKVNSTIKWVGDMTKEDNNFCYRVCNGFRPKRDIIIF